MAYLSGMLASYLVARIESSRPGAAGGWSDVVKFGAPVAGFAAAILLSNAMGWLAVRATAWQYAKAAALAGLAIPAAFLAAVALTVLIAVPLGTLIEANDATRPLFGVAAALAFGAGSAVFPLLVGYALRTLTGVWDWRLAAAMFVLLWCGLLVPSPWDRPFVSAVGGVIGLWLARAPAGGG